MTISEQTAYSRGFYGALAGEKRAGLLTAGAEALESAAPKMMQWGKGLFGGAAKAAPAVEGAVSDSSILGNAARGAFRAGGAAGAVPAASGSIGGLSGILGNAARGAFRAGGAAGAVPAASGSIGGLSAAAVKSPSFAARAFNYAKPVLPYTAGAVGGGAAATYGANKYYHNQATQMGNQLQQAAGEWADSQGPIGRGMTGLNFVFGGSSALKNTFLQIARQALTNQNMSGSNRSIVQDIITKMQAQSS